MGDTGPSCASCQHFQARTYNDADGIMPKWFTEFDGRCRRNAPRTFSSFEMSDYGWPMVRKTDVCGEFVAKDEEVEG